jgi:hypothetical protein
MINKPNIPESFRVLVKELQSLGLDVELIGSGGSVSGNMEYEAAAVEAASAPEPVAQIAGASLFEEPIKKEKKKKKTK